MRVLIAGAGRAGLSVALHLRTLDHQVIVVDRDAAVLKRVYDQHGLVLLEGDATDGALLHEAEAGRADVVVAMLRRDADNLAVALLAKEAGAKRVMVRMRDDAYRPVYLSAGVSRILSESDVFVGTFATAIEHEAVRHSMTLGTGESVAFELAIPIESLMAGKTIRDIGQDPRFPTSCVFAVLYDAGRVEAPKGSSVVSGGMTVLLVARRDELARTIEFFTRG
jgi:trk system potassium uptake protein TrkA